MTALNAIIQTVKNKKDTQVFFLQGVEDCLPTIFGYLSIGFTCGVVSKACGLSFWQTVGMSAFIYGGSSQFIAAGMILASAAVPSIILTVFLVNLRHLFMSAAMAPRFPENSLRQNFFVGLLLTDESFGVASARAAKEDSLNYDWMLGLNISGYLNWILATGMGFLFGSLIPDYTALGLDFALVGMFIGLLAAAAKGLQSLPKSAAIIMVSVLILLGSTYFASIHTAVMLAALGGAASGMVVD